MSADMLPFCDIYTPIVEFRRKACYYKTAAAEFALLPDCTAINENL